MSLSLILTNCLLCGIAALFFIPILRHPNMLTYHNGIPVLLGMAMICFKMLIPYEFFFTQTIASKNVLPEVRRIWNVSISPNATVGNVLLCIWLIIAVLFLTLLITRYWKLMSVLSAVPETENEEIVRTILGICMKKQIRKKPKVIQLDICVGPFLAGLRNPIIVLPYCPMSSKEIELILKHEIEHITNHHILVKMCMEIVMVMYWWNPFVWIMHREAVRALEIQADINVVQGLPNKDKFSYLETLITISKKIQKKQNHNLTLPFALNNSMLESRINVALKCDCFKKNMKINVFVVLALVLSVLIVLSSFMFTFESRGSGPQEEGAFTINYERDYFAHREDGIYDLYINGEWVVAMPSIPEDLSRLPIYR